MHRMAVSRAGLRGYCRQSNSTGSAETAHFPRPSLCQPARKQMAVPRDRIIPSGGASIPHVISGIPDPVALRGLRQAILRHVRFTLVRPMFRASAADYLKPVSLAIRDRIIDRLLETESRYRHKDSKKLYYLSLEWLMGRLLATTCRTSALRSFVARCWPASASAWMT